MTREPLAIKNELLAALPRGAYLRLLPHLESVSLPLGAGRNYYACYRAWLRLFR